MRMLKTPTTQAWHFQEAIIPVAADGGGGASSPPEVGDAAGPSAETVISSFIPSVQWVGMPHMYEWFPSVVSGITSSPVVRGTAVTGIVQLT